MGISGQIGRRVAPRLGHAAPGPTTAFVRAALDRAIRGVGPLPPAAAAAQAQLDEQHGDVDRAVHELIENHVRWSGLQGFVTNLGGIATLGVTVPTNISGLALLQCRLVAGIAHLRGFDLEDPRVRNAILVCILGEDTVKRLSRKKMIPGSPMVLATAPAHDPDLDRMIAGEVAAEMITRVAGKRMAVMAGRRVPLVGGLVGAGADGYSTWQVGRYADRELLPRTRR